MLFYTLIIGKEKVNVKGKRERRNIRKSQRDDIKKRKATHPLK
jgi:hypothetical protein